MWAHQPGSWSYQEDFQNARFCVLHGIKNFHDPLIEKSLPRPVYLKTRLTSRSLYVPLCWYIHPSWHLSLPPPPPKPPYNRPSTSDVLFGPFFLNPLFHYIYTTFDTFLLSAYTHDRVFHSKQAFALAETQDTGKPIADSEGEIAEAVGYLRFVVILQSMT